MEFRNGMLLDRPAEDIASSMCSDDPEKLGLGRPNRNTDTESYSPECNMIGSKPRLHGLNG